MNEPEDDSAVTADDGVSQTPFDEIVVGAQPGGVVAVQGSPAAVERFVARVERTLGSPRVAQVIQAASVLGSSIDAVPGVGEDGATPTVLQLSRRAVDILRANDVIAAGEGYFRSVIGDGTDLDWVPSGADVLQLQTAAVGLALHASLKSLGDAVERVEHRVDELRDLVRSGQVGEVLGHHRVISERLAMIDDPSGSGIGETDWAAVAHLHPHIVSGLERTRYFIRSRMGMTEPGRMVRSRVDAAARLVDANLADSLGLLATCEHNLAGWQRLRLDRVLRNEPGHLDAVVVDMESSLALHQREDQQLVDDLVELMNDLMEPTGLEGLELVQRRRLLRHVETIHAATTTFARHRDLAMASLRHGDLPGFRDSAGLIAATTRRGGAWAVDRIRRRPRQLPPPDPADRRPD